MSDSELTDTEEADDSIAARRAEEKTPRRAVLKRLMEKFRSDFSWADDECLDFDTCPAPLLNQDR